MCEQKAFYCPNPECGNMAFEPGVCSGCGAAMEEEDPVEIEDTIEGLSSFHNRPASPQIQGLPSPDVMALAKKAVAAQEARKNEDVRKWAERFVRDVGDVCD